MGYSYFLNYPRDSTTYNTNPFFIELVRRRRKIEVSTARDGTKLGFKVTVQNRGIRTPAVECNDYEYKFQKKNRENELLFLQIDKDYTFYPYEITESDSTIGVKELGSGKTVYQELTISMPHGTSGKFEGTVKSSTLEVTIYIYGEDFRQRKKFTLKTNLSELRVRRDYANAPIPAEKITFSFEEIKEPPPPTMWHKLSSLRLKLPRISK